jgi:hypothetical protein
VTQIAAVSSSAVMACAHLLSLHEELFDRLLVITRRQRKSFEPLLLLRGQRPLPHFALYRQVVTEFLTPRRFELLIAQKQRLRIVVGLSPGRSRLLAGALALYSMRRGRTMPGLSSTVIEAHDCKDAAELVSALLASSAVPILAPLPRIAGRVAVDGSAVEPIPLVGLDGRRALRPLVVLTEPALVRPIPADLPYIGPQGPAPISQWDFRNEAAWRTIYLTGRAAGARFASAQNLYARAQAVR